MKMKFFSFVLLSLLLTCRSLAQEIHPFWKDDAAIKENSYQLSLDKKKQWMSGVSRQDADTYQRIYDKHFTEVADIWQSSRSVTAPAAHQYVQSLFAQLKKNNPELAKSDARIIFTRDWWPNAYSLGEGTIVVNAGLLVWLENEAQLAFILCHELAHYHLDHSGKSIKRYVDTMNSKTVQQELKRLSKDKYRVNQQLESLSKNITFNSRRHSREYEQEADQYALNLFKKSGFDITQSITTLQLLDKIDELLASRPLQLSAVLNPTGYPFRPKWVQAESSIFSQLKTSSSLNKQERDSLKTHPDCQDRIAALEKEGISGHAATQLFFTDSSRFTQLKKELYAEMMERCYQHNNLSRYLYFALCMLQQESFQPVAVHAVAKGLNTVYQRQRDHKLGLAIDVEDKAFSEDYNLLLRMLHRIRLEELAALNYAFCSSYHQEMKGYPAFIKEYEQARNFNNTP